MYEGQNYKINKKIHDEVDKNQKYYEQEESGTITTIKRIYVYITDKKGKLLKDVSVTIGDKLFNVGTTGLLLSHFPNEETSIQAEKDGFKTAETTMLLDASIQTHKFFLALETSDEESEVISIDNTNPTKEQSILFEPALDGTDEITSWSGTNITEDGTYSGRGSFLTEGWSNEGLWQLDFDVSYKNSWYVGIMPICSEEINPFTDAKGKQYALTAWEGVAALTGLNSTSVGPVNYKYQSPDIFHHATLKKIAEDKLIWYFDSNEWEITAPNLKNLQTLHIGIRDNPASRNYGGTVVYKNIKVVSLNLKEISILVKNDDNEPIPADIKFDNEIYNTTANANGEASIKVPKDTDKFTVTLSGYETKIITIGKSNSFNITLSPLGEKIQQGKQYMFESYADNNGTELWGMGTVEVTGTTINGYTEVKVLTNEPEEEFVDQKFFVNSNAQYNDDSLYELYTDSGETGTGIYVKIFVWVIMTKGVDVDVNTSSALGNKSFRLVDLSSQQEVVQGTSNDEGIFTTINLTPNTSYEIYDAPGIQGTSVSSGASPKVPLTIWYYTSS